MDYVWHVENADEAARDGYVPRCPDCGGRLLVVAPAPRDAD
jgi:DNA-directed RNA polymerase subunit RPC12/RpoP